LVKVEQYQLTRGKAKTTSSGYTGIITIPVSDIKVGDVIGFDVAVTNNGVTASWNDYNNTQKATSKYYAELIMKPYAEIKFGTAKIDGKLDSAWKSQSVLPITVKTGSPEATANIRAMWDDKYLYIYAVVTDKKLSKANSNPWEQDSIEIFLDQNNGKTSSYEVDDCQYRINYKNEASFNGTKCNADNLISVTKLTNNGYIVEAAIKLTDVKPKNGKLIGIDFQINDDAGSGSRAGTYSWFDKTGTGYANPSVFGTVTLIRK
jgi:endo-1,4-beta-xylanase